MKLPDRIWINDKWEAYLRPTFDGDTSGYVRADLAALPARGVGVDIEEVARAIYDAMRFERKDKTPEWVKGGNSNAQVEARSTATRILAALASTDAAHVNETTKSEHDAGDVLTEYTLAPHLQKIVDGAKTTPQWDTQADRLAPTDAAQARPAGPSESAVYDRTGLPPVTVDAAQAREAAFLGVCECGMTGPCMWDQCKHPLTLEART